MSKKARSSDVEANPAVLVTGGSGYLGSSVVRHLSAAGETVVSMYRHRLPEPCARVFPVCSDLSNAELLAAPLRGVHTVIHLAWDNTFTGPGCELSSDPSEEKNLTKNIRTLKTLLQAMETAGTKRLIFMSAMGAGRHAESGFLTEKYLGEFFILNSDIPEKIILRPSVIYGGGGGRNRFISAVRRLTRFPGFYPVPDWKERIYPLNLNDLNQILSGLLKRNESAHPVKVINISGQEGYQVEEILRIVSGKDGKGARIALGSLIGKTILPLVEKDFSSRTDQVGIREFLSVCGKAINDSSDNKELTEIYSGPYQKFCDSTI